MESNFVLLQQNKPKSNKKVIGLALLAVAAIGACAFVVFQSQVQLNATTTYVAQESQVEGWVREAFQTWSVKHDKLYGSGDETNYRLLVFRENLMKIKQFYESGSKSYNLSLNTFADLTQEEFRAKYLTLQKQEIERTVRELPTDNLPEEINWVNEGVVNDVKNQASCGSCWAFSTIAAVESLYAQQTKELKRFSEQQLVDCNTEKDNQGCNGGFMQTAFEYIAKYGIEEESDYPYRAVDQRCHYSESKVAFKIGGYAEVPKQDLDQLRAAAAQQVISVAIEVNFSFQFYSGGVFESEEPCGQKWEDLNHGVALVGYGSENGQDYWLVRNSWGKSWGNHGYIKMRRTSGKGNGECGIALDSSYPTA